MTNGGPGFTSLTLAPGNCSSSETSSAARRTRPRTPQWPQHRIRSDPSDQARKVAEPGDIGQLFLANLKAGETVCPRPWLIANYHPVPQAALSAATLLVMHVGTSKVGLVGSACSNCRRGRYAF